jgi:hypothetical protein
MPEEVLRLSYPDLIKTHILDDGPVVTVNTSVSEAWVVEFMNGNIQLCVRNGHEKEARIELTPEAAEHLAERLSPKKRGRAA